MGEPAAGFMRRAAGSLALAGADVRLYPSGPFHVTAAFLGDTVPARLPALHACLRGAEADAPPPDEAALERLGAFPSWDRPSVLWAGVGPGGPAMAAAASALRARLAAAGFPAEARPFSPHATLGRVRSRRGLEALRARAAPWLAPAAWAGAAFPCGPLCVVASELKAEGAVHTILPREA